MNDKKTQNIIYIVISFVISSLGMMAYIYSSRTSIAYPEYISLAIGFTPVDLLVLCGVTRLVYMYISGKREFNIVAFICAVISAALSLYMREFFVFCIILKLIGEAPLYFAILLLGFTLLYYVFFAFLIRESHKLNFNLNSIIAGVFSLCFLVAYRYTHRDDISSLLSYIKSFNLFEVIIVYAAYHLYYSYICTKFKFRTLYLLTGLVFAITNFILNDTYKHQRFFYSLANNTILYIATLAIYTLSFYAAISYIMAYLELNADGASKPIKPFLLAFKILLLWTPIYLLFYPGAISWETSWVINNIIDIGNPRAFAPPFYQLFISLFIRLGRAMSNDTLGIVVYFVVVGYISALAMAMIINRAAKLQLSRGVMQFVYIFCIANPFIILKTFTMQYDTLMGLAMLYFSMLIYDIILEGRDFVNLKNILLLFVSGFAVCIFRNVGKVLIVVSAVSLGIYGIKKVGKKAIYCVLSLVVALVVFLASNSYLLKAMRYDEDDKLANFAIPLQQMSFVLKNRGVEALTDAEYDTLNSFIDPKKFIEKWDSNKIDAVKYEMESYWEGKRFSEENFQKLKSVWLSLGKRYPVDYIKAFVGSSYLYFVPGHFDNYYLFENYDHQIYRSRDSHSNLQHARYSMSKERARDLALNSALMGFTTLFGLYMSAGFVQLVNLFIFFFAKQRKVPIICLLPAVIYALGTVFSPVNGWIRYITPSAFVTPLFILYVLYAIKTDKSRGSITLHLDEV